MALLIEETNTVFFHFPKTGGTFFREVVGGITKTTPIKTKGFRNHVPMSAVDMTKYYDSIVFVRHPIAWYESTWKFLKDLNAAGEVSFNPRAYNSIKHLNKFYDDTFFVYMEGIIRNCPNHYQTEFFQFVDVDKVTHIGRTEHMKHYLHEILDKIGIDHERNMIFDAPRYGHRKMDCQWFPGQKEAIMEENSLLISKFYN